VVRGPSPLPSLAPSFAARRLGPKEEGWSILAVSLATIFTPGDRNRRLMLLRSHPRPPASFVILVALGVLSSGAASVAVIGLSSPAATVLPSGASGPVPTPTSVASSEATPVQNRSLGAAAACFRGTCSSVKTDEAAPDASGAYWTNLTSPQSPPWSYSEAMAYDNGSQTVLLFGTNASGGTLGDGTWEFSGGDWKDISGAVGGAPPYQTGMAMTFDQHDGYVLLFGCPGSAQVNGFCNDTWDFSAGKWHQIDALNPPRVSNVLGSSPPAGPLSLTYDAMDSYTVLTNGFATWEYVGGAWSPLCRIPTNCSAGFIPGPNLSGSAVYDPHDGYVLFVGVTDQNASIAGGGSWTWKFVGGQWTNISSTVGTAPSPRLGAMLADDSTAGNVVLFGGTRCLVYARCGIGNLNDTWTFGSGAWQNVTSGRAPPPRSFGQMADDPTDSALILFSGIVSSGSNPNSASNDTWGWGVSPPIAGLSISVAPAVPVPGTPAQFNSSFRGGVGPFTYNWSFGDGGTSALPDPSHTFGADGLYSVSLWVNDSARHVATASTQLRVYAPLGVAIVSAAPDPAGFGQPVNFTAHATGGTPPYTFAWSFGDGGVGGNLSSITHVYTTNGPFLAQVTVHDLAGGVSQASVNITILLQALVGSSSTSGSPPLTVHFVGQAQGGAPPYRYSWTFGDGESSPLQDPTHTYNASGVFTVALTVLDSKDNRSVSSLVVRVGVPVATGPSWPVEFVAAVVVAGGVAVAWVASLFIQRSRRREGERWVQELTTDSQSREKKSGP